MSSKLVAIRDGKRMLTVEGCFYLMETVMDTEASVIEVVNKLLNEEV